MKKTNKGFTLIELLAVIIILAVIALIATPIVLNVVDKAKSSSRQSSVSGYADAAKLAVFDGMFIENGKTPTINDDFINNKIGYQGDTITCGKDLETPGVYYSEDYGIVLHGCTVGKDDTLYYFASGKVYTKNENNELPEEYNKIFNGIEKSLVSTLLKQYKDTNTTGLLKDGNDYYYKGNNEEVSNNFVWYEGHLWRVISVNSDNTVTMVTQQPITAIQPATAPWTTEQQYKDSYINTWLNDVFYNSISNKSKISLNTFNVGIYNNVSEITTNQYVGLLDEEQYLKTFTEKKVSVIEALMYTDGYSNVEDWIKEAWGVSDYESVEQVLYEQCGVNTMEAVIASASCYGYGSYQNFADSYTNLRYDQTNNEFYFSNSFFNTNEVFWLGNRASSSSVRSVYNGGFLSYGGPASALGSRPVIKISDLTITSGNGTLSDPFRETKTSTNTNNIKVGEYISVPGSSSYCGSDSRCLFRVVSKDSDSVKVILNGLLPTTSAFGSTTTFSNTSTIYTPLTDFANSISTNYRYSGNKTFNIGMYGNGVNYTTLNSKTILSNVGLPVVGEMFSGNDIDLSTSTIKTFVNVGTIENPTVSNFLWTMNAYSSADVRGVLDSGVLYSYRGPTSAKGGRPVTYLNLGTNSNLTFTKGEGTAENPFWLGN